MREPRTLEAQEQKSHCLSSLSFWFSAQKPFTSNSTAHFCQQGEHVDEEKDDEDDEDNEEDEEDAVTFPSSEGPGCRATEHGRLSGN